MLQMYGEKAEEAEELKLDIQDLKIMYRQQVHDMFSITSGGHDIRQYGNTSLMLMLFRLMNLSVGEDYD